ncbi:MAG: hypothetical protein P1Q69_04435 [Candidatus Thorarchaeota archaeon]|nr:hypothetical protein [Candidatus Thorarchaeota archaeon]
MTKGTTYFVAAVPSQFVYCYFSSRMLLHLKREEDWSFNSSSNLILLNTALLLQEVPFVVNVFLNTIPEIFPLILEEVLELLLNLPFFDLDYISSFSWKRRLTQRANKESEPL